MLSVLVINDSEHAALKKSQRVLAKYLPQVGPATYMGSLSREGLRDLELELVGMRSRYLSVGCYLMSHNLSPSLTWVVGSKKNFDEEHSLYAHRRRAVTPPLPYFAGTFTSKLLALTVRLAALTHDLGKMNDAFQAKLWRACGGKAGPKGEFIRHDAMSYRVLRGLGWDYAALKSLPALTPEALATVVAAKSAAELRDTFDAYLKVDLNRLRRVLVPGGRARTPVAPPSLEELVCQIAAFLSLTHHRLPGPSRRTRDANLTYELSLTAETYFNSAEEASFGTCLQFSGGNVFHLDRDLGASLTKVLDDLQDLTNAAPADFDQSAFLRLMLMYGRPVLVLSDYLASGLKSGEAVADGTLLGNTVRPANDALPGKPGDTLATHVRSVYHHARRQTQFALNLSANQLDPLPALSTSAQRAIDAKRSLVGRFAWQSELREHLQAQSRALPAFVAVTAGTGSGKTIASAQIMRALGTSRWTYCLGLRSLTLQTGRSYQEDLNLTDADLAVVIGDRVAKKAFEKEAGAGAAAAGSESMGQEPEAVLKATSQPEDWISLISAGHKPAELKDVFTARKLDFVAAPVVVCTVDQLIGVTRLASVTKAFDYKRLQSADLVLDEIDNYSPDELKHIVRLCFLVGLARKNLVCLSATMGPLHVEALLAAYREGVRLNNQLTGLGADLLFTTASNTCAPASLTLPAGAPLQAALEHNERFNQATRDVGDKLPTKAVLALLDCQAKEHARVLEEAIRLHQLNATDVDGARVSAGFIKMNTVGSARNLAKHLFEVTDLPADLELAVVCYHARYTGLEMTLIDRALNEVTNRKRLPADSEFSREALARYISPILAGTRKKNLVIIAVTTSIIETGRDHDYDWAILEPSSHRSLIQAAGRVRRHRDASASRSQNVSLIAYPDRACTEAGFVPKSPVHVFSYPGPLTALAEKKFSNAELPYPHLLAQACAELGVSHAVSADLARDASAHGFLPAYPDGIRNVVALTPPRDLTNSLAVLEQYVLFKSLTEKAPMDVLNRRLESVSAVAQQDKALWLTTWAYQESFRDDSLTYIEDQLYLMQARVLATGKYVVGSPLTSAGSTAASVCSERVELAHPFRSLLRGGAGGADLQSLLASEAEELAGHGFTKTDLLEFACYSPERRGLVPAKVFYQPLIGFNSTPVK